MDVLELLENAKHNIESYKKYGISPLLSAALEQLEAAIEELGSEDE